MSRADLQDLAFVFDTCQIQVQSNVTGRWPLTDEARAVIAAALRAYAPASSCESQPSTRE